MYRGVNLVVLPRRYGGLCLPALEAAASGCALAMTNTPPNGHWPIMPIDCRQGRNLNTQAGLIRTVNAVPDSVAYTINTLARNRGRASARSRPMRGIGRNATRGHGSHPSTTRCSRGRYENPHGRQLDPLPQPLLGGVRRAAGGVARRAALGARE